MYHPTRLTTCSSQSLNSTPRSFSVLLVSNIIFDVACDPPNGRIPSFTASGNFLPTMSLASSHTLPSTPPLLQMNFWFPSIEGSRDLTCVYATSSTCTVAPSSGNGSDPPSNSCVSKELDP